MDGWSDSTAGRPKIEILEHHQPAVALSTNVTMRS
jgi:hypothetical protein